MHISKVLVRYGDFVIPEEEGKFGSTYITERGHELLVIELALQTLKRILGKRGCGEVYLASDLAKNCHKEFLSRIKEDKSFIPAGITLITLLSDSSVLES